MSLHYCSILPQNHDSDYLEESRRIRAEQDRAYAESLAADIEKEELKVRLMFQNNHIHNTLNYSARKREGKK